MAKSGRRLAKIIWCVISVTTHLHHIWGEKSKPIDERHFYIRRFHKYTNTHQFVKGNYTWIKTLNSYVISLPGHISCSVLPPTPLLTFFSRLADVIFSFIFEEARSWKEREFWFPAPLSDDYVEATLLMLLELDFLTLLWLLYVCIYTHTLLVVPKRNWF